MEHAPVEHMPAPVEHMPALVERTPAFGESAFSPEELAPAPVEVAPAPEGFAFTPAEMAPVELASALVELASALVEHASAPVELASAERTPRPLDRVPALIDRAAALKDRAPAPMDRVPTSMDRAPAVQEDSPAPMNRAPALQEDSPAAEKQMPVRQTQKTGSKPVASKSKHNGQTVLLSFLIGIVGVLIGAALSIVLMYGATDGFNFSGSTEPGTSYPNITITPIPDDPTLAIAVAAKVMPSVVSIDVYTTSSPGSIYDGSGSIDNYTEYGLGSGIVLTSDGYILTNYHVLEGGTRFLVGFYGGEQMEGTVAGTDPQSDLAILKVAASGLKPIEIGNSSTVVVGEWVMAVGCPFGLERSVSVGIVSALFRSTTLESSEGLSIYANMIQTDAAINPGNSGGALVDNQGRLIGVTTLISSTSGSSAGVGFAIPINYAMNIAEQIRSGNPVQHAFLGITVRTLNPSLASALGVSVSSGAYIETVSSDSPASRSGLKQGDVITAFDGEPVSTATELIINIRGQMVGDTVTLTVVRGAQTLDIDVVLGSDSNA